MIYDYLQPVAASFFENLSFKESQLGSIVEFYTDQKFDFHEVDIAIIGIDEIRNAVGNTATAEAPAAFRKEFLKLYTPVIDRSIKIVDLGNIKTGANVRDTYFGLSSVLLHLLTHKVVPIIIGGSHDNTYGQYLAYQELYALINMVIIDEKIDLNEMQTSLTADSFMMSILAHTPNYLFNYSHIGYQTYLNDKHAIEMLESLNFDCIRLGIARQNLEDTEPHFRDADMLSIDMNCLRMADFPAHENASPNGFSGEELCQMARFAGLSDKLSSIGFYEMNPAFDRNSQSSQLLAQAVWCFVEGYYQRKNDMPNKSSDFLKFTVKLDAYDHELIFWKSKVTNRWWMELPFGEKKDLQKQQMVPCTFADYEQACREEVPDRWMRVYHKLIS